MPPAPASTSRPAAEGEAPSSRPRHRPRPGWPEVLLALTVIALALTLVVHVSPWVTKGFGFSHDGYNGAMWALGARGAVEDPIGNRLGGIQPSGHPYANHPPLLVWTTAVTGGITGERPIALRAPALLASMAALAVMAALLRDAGYGAAATAGGLALAGTSAMFLTYGAMLDTPVLSLPFGLAALWAAQRCWQGRPPPRPVLIAAGLLAALAGWQSLLAAAMATALVLVAPTRPGRRAGRALGAGALAGLALTLTWVAWARGTLLGLGTQAAHRTRIGTAEWFDRQIAHTGDLYGPVLLGVAAAGTLCALIGAGAGDRAGDDRRRRGWRGPRPLAGVVAAVVVAYTVALREASATHDYWTYWGVALLAVAATALLHTIAHGIRRLPRPAAVTVRALAAAAVVTLAAAGAAHRSDADHYIREGLDAVPVLAAAPRAPRPDQPSLVMRYQPIETPWADFATHGRNRTATPAELALLPPDQLVFLVAVGEPSPEVRAAAIASQGRYVLMRAGDYQRLVA